MKEKTQNITFYGVILFICCYFMRIMNLPNALTVVCGAALSLLLLVQQKKFRIDTGICLLTLALAAHYVIANGARGILYAILYIPPMIYVLGGYSVCAARNSREFDKKLLWLIFAMIAGYTILGILNSYMYYAGYVVPGTRRWQDFWSHEIVPGTQHTAYFLPVLAMFFPAVMYFKRRKSVNVLLVVLTLFFCYTALATRSRMQLVIFVLVCVAQLILFLLLEKEKTKKILSNKYTWIVMIVLLIACVGGFLVVKDTEIVATFINNMGKGGGIFKNVRFEAQRMALLQLFDYPFGGCQMELGRAFCHNTWLDMANASGVIPFFLFTAYTIYTVYEVVKLLLKKKYSSETKIIFSGLYLAFFLYMTVEPALEASVHLLTPWIFINGLIHGVVCES